MCLHLDIRTEVGFATVCKIRKIIGQDMFLSENELMGYPVNIEAADTLMKKRTAIKYWYRKIHFNYDGGTPRKNTE
jgi:hypothetical protein